MSFSAYKRQTDAESLGISVASANFIPRESLAPIEASDWLNTSLLRGAPYGRVSEKARSEMFIAPVILEIITNNRDNFTALSGVNLEAKFGENGKALKGAVDFLICKGKELFGLKSPIIALVEAKKDDLETGYWQCAAEMVAAELFNRENGQPTATIWGCVSTGFEWQFLNLNDHQLSIEKNIYTLNNLPQLLAAWQ